MGPLSHNALTQIVGEIVASTSRAAVSPEPDCRIIRLVDKYRSLGFAAAKL
jgi:hypothetical protein